MQDKQQGNLCAAFRVFRASCQLRGSGKNRISFSEAENPRTIGRYLAKPVFTEGPLRAREHVQESLFGEATTIFDLEPKAGSQIEAGGIFDCLGRNQRKHLVLIRHRHRLPQVPIARPRPAVVSGLRMISCKEAPDVVWVVRDFYPTAVLHTARRTP